MTDRELFIKALDALEWNLPVIQDYGDKEQLNIQHNAITALRDRLAQTEPGPVTHTLNCVCGAVWDIKNDKSEEMVHTPDTTPPQRKSLSDEEILTYKHMIDWTAEWSYINFARAIEAVHGIKENNQ